MKNTEIVYECKTNVKKSLFDIFLYIKFKNSNSFICKGILFFLMDLPICL